MASSVSTLRRMDEQVSSLIRDLRIHLDKFESSRLFSGPSIHFHVKTLELRRGMGLAALTDERFLTCAYATLTAWGMHRMGPGNTKLVDFEPFCTSVRNQTDTLARFAHLHLADIDVEQVPSVAAELWECLKEIRVSPAEARIVSSTKVGHHLLPDLIPPIDREYSFMFFYQRRNLSISDADAFNEMFTRICRIGREGRLVLERRLQDHGHPMNSSIPKLIDNAIVGYALNRRPNEELA